jgi:hypothetical protein
VITTVLTGPDAGDAVTGLVQNIGKIPVAVTDRAGFAANALPPPPCLNHAVTLLETGYATRRTSTRPPGPGSACRYARSPCPTHCDHDVRRMPYSDGREPT